MLLLLLLWCFISKLDCWISRRKNKNVWIMKGGNFPRYLTCAEKYYRKTKLKERKSKEKKPSSRCFFFSFRSFKQKIQWKSIENVDRIKRVKKVWTVPPSFSRFLPTSKFNFNDLSLIKKSKKFLKSQKFPLLFGEAMSWNVMIWLNEL